MYSTCLYCTKDLGANDVLETLPIGRRIAFDAANGRLWVVCASCGKWNLVPFDTRLETIDACERRFAETRVRFSTDHIGIARLTEGLELVRIGAALRPEFAAWRYGRQFAGRRRKQLIVRAGSGAIRGIGNLFGPAGIIGGLLVAGVWAAAGGDSPQDIWRRRSIAMLIARTDGEPPNVLTLADLDDVRIAAYRDGWNIAFADRRVRPGLKVTAAADLPDCLVHGPEALQLLGRVLPRIAGTAGSAPQLRLALGLLERSPDGDALMAKHFKPFQRAVSTVGSSLRLALEMAAHEQTERTALAGELKLLERQWQEAEALAKIIDRISVDHASSVES